MFPAIMVSAWRVRLMLPLLRLPGIIILSLPWIYCPLLWVCLLPMWQLMSNPLLLVGLLLVSFGKLNWMITSVIFNTNEPMPGEQLCFILRKQSYIDSLLSFGGYGFVIMWFFGSHSYGGTSFREYVFQVVLSWQFVFLVIKGCFKFLITRVAAMDFIIYTITSDHFFELGVNAVRSKVQPTMPEFSTEMSVLDKSSIETPQYGQVLSRISATTTMLDDEITYELSAGMYGQETADELHWEHMALVDVLETAQGREMELDAMVDIQRRCWLKGVKMKEEEAMEAEEPLDAIEMTSLDLLQGASEPFIKSETSPRSETLDEISQPRKSIAAQRKSIAAERNSIAAKRHSIAPKKGDMLDYRQLVSEYNPVVHQSTPPVPQYPFGGMMYPGGMYPGMYPGGMYPAGMYPA